MRSLCANAGRDASRLAASPQATRQERANCLLKTLEEPPPRAVIILIGTSPQRQLPTIRSRSQIIRFSPLERETIAQLLKSQQTVESSAEAERIAAHSQGSLARATELLDAEYWAFREAWLQRLSAPVFDSLAGAAAITALAEAAGKESSARRGRIRQAIELTVDFYSVLAKAIAGSDLQEDDDVAAAVAARTASWRGGEDAAIDATERSLDAREQLDRYGHQATVVECWLDDLARIHELALRG
jgi:DNA polymerase-3 subunit delta'